MKPIKTDIEGYNRHIGVKTLHRMVSVINFNEVDEIRSFLFNIDFYAVFLKETKNGELTYGRQHYDYQEGSIVCISPGQVIGIKTPEEMFRPQGRGLLFHPDLIAGTPLAAKMKKYTFFAYDADEALHLSERERNVILDCFDKITEELNLPVDNHSQTLICVYIELLLEYCTRFYERQFITRRKTNTDLLARFERLLHDYFRSGRPMRDGLPTVRHFASELCLSPNYFGDLIRKECGKSAQEYIQDTIISIAKDRLSDPSKSIGQVAEELGFQYLPYFSRMFKKHAGKTPGAFRREIRSGSGTGKPPGGNGI